MNVRFFFFFAILCQKSTLAVCLAVAYKLLATLTVKGFQMHILGNVDIEHTCCMLYWFVEHCDKCLCYRRMLPS
jgi:hypothetical protein